MSDVKVGSLINESAKRDAIHVAIAPVIASERVIAGQHIGFTTDDNETVGHVDNPIGIVDPFFVGSVYPGQRFFMFLYPYTITSLTHQWEHPAFKINPVKFEAERWLRQFADLYCHSYDEMVQEALTGNMCFGSDSVNDINDIEKERFYNNVELVSGQKVKDRLDYFRCAC